MACIAIPYSIINRPETDAQAKMRFHIKISEIQKNKQKFQELIAEEIEYLSDDTDHMLQIRNDMKKEDRNELFF